MFNLETATDEYATYIAHSISELEIAAPTDEDFIEQVADMIAREIREAREAGYREGIASLLRGD